jgi:hypothetical protein
MPHTAVSIDDQVFAHDGEAAFGAVRGVHAHALLVYVEGIGDVTVPAAAVTSVHAGKVIVDVAALPVDIQKGIAAAHRREEPGA